MTAAAPETPATPGQAARTELEAAVRLAITENRDCRGSVPPGFCERRAAEALAAVDAYVAARQPQPAPGGITRVHHTSIRMPRHPDPIVFGDWHPPAALGFAVESGDSD